MIEMFRGAFVLLMLVGCACFIALYSLAWNIIDLLTSINLRLENIENKSIDKGDK